MGLDSFAGSESVNRPRSSGLFKVLRLNKESIEGTIFAVFWGLKNIATQVFVTPSKLWIMGIYATMHVQTRAARAGSGHCVRPNKKLSRISEELIAYKEICRPGASLKAALLPQGKIQADMALTRRASRETLREAVLRCRIPRVAAR